MNSENLKATIQKEYIVKIYFKNKRKPFELIINKKDHFENMYTHLLASDPIIKIGTFIFNSENFKCATLEEI